MRLLILLLLALAVPARAAQQYVVTCSAPCLAPDGTTQPAGTALNRIVASAGFSPGAGLALVPDIGQALYLPPMPATTPAQQAAALLGSGLSVTSTGGAFAAPFAADPAMTANIAVERLSLLANGTFTNGRTTLQWPGLVGGWHTLSVAQFIALANAIAAFVTALNLYASGAPGAALPVATAEIP